MKEILKNRKFIIAAVAVAMVLIVTNPSEQAHKDKVVNVILQKVAPTMEGNPFAVFANTFAVNMVNSMVRRNNYIFFSTTEISYLGNSRVIGYGVLGMVNINKEATDRLNEVSQ